MGFSALNSYHDHYGTAHHIHRLETEGYTVISGVLSKDLIEKLTARISLTKQRALTKKAGISPNQMRDKIVYHLQFIDSNFLHLISSFDYGLKLIDHFLSDPNYRSIPYCNFLLGSLNARSSVEELPLHIDNYFPSTGYFPNSMQMVFSLSGQTRENGCTFLVPKSHLSGAYPMNSAETIDVYCNPGDVIVWDSRIWHGAHENKSGEDRWSIVATFRPWFMKQNFDIVKGSSQELYKEWTVFEKTLLGFLSTAPNGTTEERINLKQSTDELRVNLDDYK